MPPVAVPPTSGPTTETSAYAVSPMKATSKTPPTGCVGSPVVYVVDAPVAVSTRTIAPLARAATYRAPSGPIVLPIEPPRPEARTSATGSGASGLSAFAAAGMSTAGRSTAVIAAARSAALLLRISCTAVDRRARGRTADAVDPHWRCPAPDHGCRCTKVSTGPDSSGREESSRIPHLCDAPKSRAIDHSECRADERLARD